MGVFQLLSWRFPPNTDRAEPGQATCASCKGAVKLAHLILQSSHSLLQMKLKPLIWNRQKLIHGIWWVFVVFFIHFFSLLCLKQEKRKLINFKSKYSHSFKSTREPWCERPVPWFPRRSPPTATSGGLLSIPRADGRVQREAGTSLVKGHSQHFSLAEHLGDLSVTSHFLSKRLEEQADLHSETSTLERGSAYTHVGGGISQYIKEAWFWIKGVTWIQFIKQKVRKFILEKKPVEIDFHIFFFTWNITWIVCNDCSCSVTQ